MRQIFSEERLQLDSREWSSTAGHIGTFVKARNQNVETFTKNLRIWKHNSYLPDVATRQLQLYERRTHLSTIEKNPNHREPKKIQKVFITLEAKHRNENSGG